MCVYTYCFLFSCSVIQTVTDILSSVRLPVTFHPGRQSHLLVAEAQQEGTQTGKEPSPELGSMIAAVIFVLWQVPFSVKLHSAGRKLRAAWLSPSKQLCFANTSRSLKGDSKCYALQFFAFPLETLFIIILRNKCKMLFLFTQPFECPQLSAVCLSKWKVFWGK